MNVHFGTDVSERPKEADKRARLLAAALDLFEARGYDGVAVPEIARAADVATGTIYRYFENKEALVNGLYRHWRKAYNDLVHAPAPGQYGPKTLFGYRWQRIMLFARTHPKAMRFLFLHHHAPYLDAESRALEDEDRLAMESLVSGAKVPPPLVAALVWGAAAGLTKFLAASTDMRDAASDMEEALWRALVG